jgi:hypothetical protein
LIALLLENAVRSAEVLTEPNEAIGIMIEMVLEKMNEDSEKNIHLSLRIISKLFMALE